MTSFSEPSAQPKGSPTSSAFSLLCSRFIPDRACRIGQDEPVNVHKLLCQDTVEERIHRLRQEKAKLAEGLLADADVGRELYASIIREPLGAVEKFMIPALALLSSEVHGS